MTKGLTLTSKVPRRRFLAQLGATVAVAGGVVGCTSPAGEGESDATGPVPAGNVSGVAVGSLAAVPGHPVALGRDSGGLYAMTTICTHLRCNIATRGTISSAGLGCGCHGSQYTRNGEVTNGPAPAPLKHYKVDLAADGSITVQCDSVVAADDRTLVPAST